MDQLAKLLAENDEYAQAFLRLFDRMIAELKSQDSQPPKPTEIKEPIDPEPTEIKEPIDPEPIDPEPTEIQEPIDPEPTEITEPNVETEIQVQTEQSTLAEPLFNSEEDRNLAVELYIEDVNMTLFELVSAYSERGNVIEKLNIDLADKEKTLIEMTASQAYRGNIIEKLETALERKEKVRVELETKCSQLAAEHSALLKEKADRQATLEKYKSADLVQVVAKLDQKLAKEQKKAGRLQQLLDQEKQIAARTVRTLESNLAAEERPCDRLARIAKTLYRSHPMSLYDRYCFGDY